MTQSHPMCMSRCRFNKINGVLIPGGSQDLSPGHPYFASVALLLNLTKEANDKGDFFPVRFRIYFVGTCERLMSRDQRLLLLTIPRCQPACMATDAWHLLGCGALLIAMCCKQHSLAQPFRGRPPTAHCLTADACHVSGHGGRLGGGGSGELAFGDI